MCGIYIITNKVNGKVYIGQAIDMESRFSSHKLTAFNKNDKGYSYPLYRAIRKYGIENFSFDVLEQCTQSQLNNREIFYIAQYNAHGPGGYNQTDGGDHAIVPQKLTKESVALIMNRLATSLDSCKTIGDEFGVSATTVESINKGKSWHEDGRTYPIRKSICEIKKNLNQNVCQICGKQISRGAELCRSCFKQDCRKVPNRPDKLELAKLIKDNGFAGTGKLFGVAGNVVKKWCEQCGLPKHIEKILEWHSERTGEEQKIKTKKQRTPITEIMRQVKQIDKDTGEVLNVFPSIKAAALAMGNKNMDRHIGAACHGKRKTAYGYMWEFA